MTYTTFGLPILAFALATIRFECAFRLCPAFSESVFTGLARRVTVICLACLVMPRVLPCLTPFPNGWQLMCLIMREVIIGCGLGFLASLPFRVGEMVGNMIDNQRGATMGEVFSPMSGSQEAPTATFLVQLLITLFYLGGVLFIFLEALYGSFVLFPIAFTPLAIAEHFPVQLLGLTDELMRGVVVLAAPAVIVMVLATVGLGIVNRSAPQLNVFFLSMPIKSALGLLVLLLCIRFMVEVIFPPDLFHTLEAWFH